MKNAISIVLIVLLSACASKPTAPSAPEKVRRGQIPFPESTLLQEGMGLHMGGFSGLLFEGVNASGDLNFMTHTDRGPNAENYKDKKTKHEIRPFLIPAFQPRWIRFTVNQATGRIQFGDEVRLTFPNGRAMTGLPNLEPDGKREGDEVPVNIRKEVLALDLMGVDPEGLTVDSKGFLWMGEEYRPSLMKFTPDGKLLRRYVPTGSFTPAEIKKIDVDYGVDLVLQVLPEEYKKRKRNRGFEAIAAMNGKILAMLQSPLPGEKNQIRLLEFDPEKEETTRDWVYDLDSEQVDKIGDMTVQGEDLLIIEQDGKSGPQGQHRVYRVSPKRLLPNGHLQKTLVVDLVKAGFGDFDKVEGLAVVDDHTIAVVNDNDFGLNGEVDSKTGDPVVDPNRRSFLGLIQIPPASAKPTAPATSK